jgi:hypothetical protein
MPPKLLLLLVQVTAAKIRGVRVLAVGTKPALGGPLDTAAARKAQDKDVKYVTRKKPRKELAHDAARWFGRRGYVVDDVGVNTQPVGDDELVVLSARVLPCGPVRLKTANGTRVTTRPGTVARRLGLRRGQPFCWDPTRLAALVREDGGLVRSGVLCLRPFSLRRRLIELRAVDGVTVTATAWGVTRDSHVSTQFRAEATKARASVENGVVALDLTVAEPSYHMVTPELDVDADGARVFVKLQDRNVLGLGVEAEVETSCARHEAPELYTSLRGERGWAVRLKPLGARSLSGRLDGRRVDATLDVEEVPGSGAVAALTLAKQRLGSAWRLAAGRQAGKGPFATVGAALSRGPFETYASFGGGAPLQERGLASPRLCERAPGADRKDALSDTFDGGLVGCRVAVDRRVRDASLGVFADACAAKDWGSALVTDAAYGVSLSYSLLRVDVTKRAGALRARPAVTLRLADPGAGVRCP